jgi:hypothetical protein
VVRRVGAGSPNHRPHPPPKRPAACSVVRCGPEVRAPCVGEGSQGGGAVGLSRISQVGLELFLRKVDGGDTVAVEL